MTDTKAELGTPLEIIAKKEKNQRNSNRRKYHEDRITKILGELTPEEAAAKLALEISALEKQVDTDKLTGLKNFDSGTRELDRQMSIATDKGKALSVLMFDLDGFKAVNDTQGHEAGNRAIKVMADFLKEGTGSADIACRYGGDEYFLIMPNSGIAEARGLGKRVLQELPTLMQERGFNVTTSVGFSSLRLDTEDASTLINEADLALKTAKDSGKNRIEVFGPFKLK